MQLITTAERTWLGTATVREKRVRLELLDSDENLLDTLDLESDTSAGQIVAGSVQVDSTRDVLRSFDLALADPEHYWTVGPGARLWLDRLVRLSIGYVINGTVRYWPQGIYLMAAPEVDASTAQRLVRLSGVDKSAMANGRPRGGLRSVITIAKDRPLHAALGDLMDLSQWGETRRNLTATSAVLPWQMSWGPPGGSPWAAAKEVAAIPDLLAGSDSIYRLYYDATGQVVYQIDPDPLGLSPVWTFAPSEVGISLLIGARRQIDDSELRNAVLVRGGGPKSAVVEAYVEDTSTYLGVSAIGYRLHYYRGGQPDPLITTEEEATARAQYELRRLLAWQERIPLTLVELPPLDPWDVIRVVDPVAGINDTYQLLRYNLSLTSEGTMQVEAWRVRRVVT